MFNEYNFIHSTTESLVNTMDDLHPTPLPRPRRPRKRARTPNPEVRRRLLEAASELILEDGMPGLRVEDVASHAGLSVGTFYVYFEGKEDLFSTLVVEYTARLREAMQAAYRGPGSLAERLARGLAAYLDFAEANEKGFLYFRDAGTIRTQAGRLSTWALGQHAQDLRPLLEEGIAAGTYRDEDPELLTQSILGLIQHLAGWWLEHRDQCSKEDLQRLVWTLTGRGMLR